MTFKRGCVVLLLISASACGGNGSPTASSAPATPSPAPILRPTSTFHVTGIVTDDDGSPVTGATVTIQPWIYGGVVPSVSGMTDGRAFYSIDFDANRDAAGGVAYVKGESSGHDPSYYYLIPPSASQNASQNLHLYRIKRITAGESTALTVLPGDTSCGDSDQFVCRTVHIVAPTDGTMTINAVPTPSAANAGLEISAPSYRCCGGTTSIPVTAGAEVIANVGMWGNSTASQSFVLNTSLVRP